MYTMKISILQHYQKFLINIVGVGVTDNFWGSIFKNKGNFSLWCQSICLDIIQRNFSILSIFDGLPGKKLEPVNFIKSANSSKIGRVQFFARQTVKNWQNRKISLYYVQTHRLASKTKVSLVFEDRPPKSVINPYP